MAPQPAEVWVLSVRPPVNPSGTGLRSVFFCLPYPCPFGALNARVTQRSRVYPSLDWKLPILAFL